MEKALVSFICWNRAGLNARNLNALLKSTDDFESVLICALRYCLGRQTYMPSIVIAFVRPMLSALSVRALSVIVRDIENAKGGAPGLGDPNIDAPLWLNLLNAAKAELEGRKGADE